MIAGLEVGLAFILLAVGFIIPVLVVIVLRRLPRNASIAPEIHSTSLSPDSSSLNEAILTVQFGGRIEYINDLAREWFGLRDGEPADLERLVRRARPGEDLLHLCAQQGQKRLSVGGRLVDATSYQVPSPFPVMLITMRTVELTNGMSDARGDSSTLYLISDFGKNVSASLDLNETIHAILLNVSHLVPADLLELKVWEEAS